MAYLVTYRGLQITCNTLVDIDRLADRLEGQRPNGSARSISGAVSHMPKGSKQILKILAEKEDPISRTELAKLAGYKPDQLSGPITGISKWLKDSGFKLQHVLDSTPANGHGERHYALVGDAIEEVRAGLGK
jgi:hypothetical protein